MRIHKPANVGAKSFVFRPSRALDGNYSIGLAIEASGPGAVVIFNWCGSRRQISLLPNLSSYVTNLKLPVSLSAEDAFVLSVTSKARIMLSIDLWGNGQTTTDIAMEELEGETSVPTVCANPATVRDRKFEDSLVMGEAAVPARRRNPVGRIESLRALPEGAVLHLFFHRPADAQPASDLLIRASVGAMRRLCIVAAGKTGNSVTFLLQPEAAGESWPLIFHSEQPFTWSGGAQRGFDSVFLPAFSLED
jgi:hypothetical protein